MIGGVTASPIELQNMFQNYLNFNQIVATRVSTENGRYASRLLKPWPVRKGKAEVVLQLASNSI